MVDSFKILLRILKRSTNYNRRMYKWDNWNLIPCFCDKDFCKNWKRHSSTTWSQFSGTDWDTAQIESILIIPLACDLNFLIKELPIFKKTPSIFLSFFFCYFLQRYILWEHRRESKKKKSVVLNQHRFCSLRRHLASGNIQGSFWLSQLK